VLNYKYPDYILKYIDDKNPVSQLKRGNFERLLLRSGLILEHEMDEVFECTYIKIFAPFEKLCEQAQMIKLKMRLDVNFIILAFILICLIIISNIVFSLASIFTGNRIRSS
jgi:hypothetical protein